MQEDVAPANEGKVNSSCSLRQGDLFPANKRKEQPPGQIAKNGKEL